MLRLWINFKRQLSGVTDVDTYPVSIPTGLIYGYTIALGKLYKPVPSS